ncbi:MAG TPA: serine hydrolase domain-containing protein [Candidatus Acidoferrales bacterium]|nr:serine hydrolase domain-containing protein [Candidatus Acidoferrales bacterium]
MQLFGACDPRFTRVRDAFEQNFATRGELGASICVIADGRTVVDLCGGVADRHSGRPWTPDTLAMVFSSTKGATALCAHVLAARGELDLDAPVARYWPEFAAAGKATIPIRQLLNHQSGLCGIDRKLPAQALFDWHTMIDALAAQAPLWEPGTAHGYHAMTFGYLVGEIVRRISSRSLGQFFRDEVGGPLGLDFWIGLPSAYESRLATIRMAPPRTGPSPLFTAMMQRGSLTWKAFMNPRGLISSTQANSRAVHAAEIPASNGITNARGLAGMYAPLACDGAWRGATLVDRETLRTMSAVESEGDDLVLLVPTRFASGYMKSVDNRPRDSVRFGPNDVAFGHVGAGGSFGFADPQARVAVGYVMNQMGQGVLLNERGQVLIDAVYEALG